MHPSLNHYQLVMQHHVGLEKHVLEIDFIVIQIIMSSIIESNPNILGGKPVVKGTRVPVDLIYELIGLKYSIEYILDQYPSLTRDALVKITQAVMENRAI